MAGAKAEVLRPQKRARTSNGGREANNELSWVLFELVLQHLEDMNEMLTSMKAIIQQTHEALEARGL